MQFYIFIEVANEDETNVYQYKQNYYFSTSAKCSGFLPLNSLGLEK